MSINMLDSKFCKKLLAILFLLVAVNLIVYVDNRKNLKSLEDNSVTIKLPFKRVLYFSTHSGTIDEMDYVFKKRKINFTVSIYDIFKKYGYSISESIANEIINSGLVKKICNEFDLIIVGDTIPLGRAFYQASPNICKSKIAIQVTNRFDFAVQDKKQYFELMRKLVNNPDVYWIPNNDYDMFYLHLHEIKPKPESMMLIRPFGVSYQEKLMIKEKKTIIYTKFCLDFLKSYLKTNNVSNKKYEIHSSPSYGGPFTLKGQYLFIYFPYQFSTMKVFQNANYRVLTAIPSPKFFKKIVLSDTTHEQYSNMKWLLENVKDWTEYFDVYHSSYIEMYIQFDSWNELIDLINGKYFNFYHAKFYNRIKKIMKLHRQETDEKWDEFFRKILN